MKARTATLPVERNLLLYQRRFYLGFAFRSANKNELSGAWAAIGFAAGRFDPEAPGLYGADAVALVPSERAAPPDLARSVYDLVRGQAEHIKQMSDELYEARRALTERKQIERAKGLLMHNLKLTEEQAFRRMQKRAMEQNIRLAEVAESLIEAAEQVKEQSRRDKRAKSR